MKFDPSYEAILEQMEPPDLKVIVSLSGGNASACAAKRAIDKYGKDKVELVFADTTIEDEDAYRFLDDCERVFGMKITRLKDGRDPYQVAEDERIIPNQMLAKCSERLKTDVIRDYVRGLRENGDVVVMVIGFDYKDAKPKGKAKQGRLPAPRKHWAKEGVLVWYPLLDTPKELDSTATVRALGIKPQVMYERGYSHGNCKGKCVKQGKDDWRRTLTYDRLGYLKVENWELAMQAWQWATALAELYGCLITKNYARISKINFDQYTLLRDDREGFDGHITLRDLRIETENANPHQLRIFALEDDMGKVCGVECGGYGSDDNAA